MQTQSVTRRKCRLWKCLSSGPPLPCTAGLRRARIKHFPWLHYPPHPVWHNIWKAIQWRFARNGIQGMAWVIKKTWSRWNCGKYEQSPMGSGTLVIFAWLWDGGVPHVRSRSNIIWGIIQRRVRRNLVKNYISSNLKVILWNSPLISTDQFNMRARKFLSHFFLVFQLTYIHSKESNAMLLRPVI